MPWSQVTAPARLSRHVHAGPGVMLPAEVSVAHVEEMFAVITREHQEAGRRCHRRGGPRGGVDRRPCPALA